MNHCSNCGQDSPTNTNFCIKCGVAFSASGSKTFPGRPVISMDPLKQGQPAEYSSQPLNQNQNPPTTQFNPSAAPMQMSPKGNQKKKRLVGVVGAVIAIIAVVVFLGQKDSTSSNVSPNDQQSQTDYIPVSTESSQYYSSSDDYPMEFRDAFVNSCFGGGAPYDDCVCLLESLEATYSVDELLSFGTSDTSYMDDAVSNCI